MLILFHLFEAFCEFWRFFWLVFARSFDAKLKLEIMWRLFSKFNLWSDHLLATCESFYIWKYRKYRIFKMVIWFTHWLSGSSNGCSTFCNGFQTQKLAYLLYWSQKYMFGYHFRQNPMNNNHYISINHTQTLINWNNIWFLSLYVILIANIYQSTVLSNDTININ